MLDSTCWAEKGPPGCWIRKISKSCTWRSDNKRSDRRRRRKSNEFLSWNWWDRRANVSALLGFSNNHGPKVGVKYHEKSGNVLRQWLNGAHVARKCQNYFVVRIFKLKPNCVIHKTVLSLFVNHRFNIFFLLNIFIK